MDTYVVQSIRYSTQAWADAAEFDNEAEARDQLKVFRDNLSDIGPFRLVHRVETVLDES